MFNLLYSKETFYLNIPIAIPNRSFLEDPEDGFIINLLDPLMHCPGILT